MILMSFIELRLLFIQLTICLESKEVNSDESQSSTVSLTQFMLAEPVSLREILRAPAVPVTTVLSHPDVIALLKANDKQIIQ